MTPYAQAGNESFPAKDWLKNGGHLELSYEQLFEYDMSERLEILKGDHNLLLNAQSSPGFVPLSTKTYYVRANSTPQMLTVCEEIAAELGRFDVSGERIQNFSIALSEAIANAQEHGLRFSSENSVLVQVYLIGDKCFVAGIHSIGNPLDFEKVKILLKQNNALRSNALRGRGFLLMYKAVDLLLVSAKGHHTTLFLGLIGEFGGNSPDAK